MGTYKVSRHGGNRNHTWKTLYEGTSEKEAYYTYDHVLVNLRQGTLVLEHEGKILEKEGAPRLRTRW